MRRAVAVALLGVAVALGLGYVIAVPLPRWWAARTAAPPPPAPAAPVTDARRIHASLFFISEDGMRLVAVDREIPYGENALDQARALVLAQLGPAPAPLAQAIPVGTTLRGLFVVDDHAVVDLSKEATSRHRGGSLDEIFSVYALVNALTVNLPAITRVQILVDGKEVDTLAGHVDLREPLRKNLTWVSPPSDLAPVGPAPPSGP